MGQSKDSALPWILAPLLLLAVVGVLGLFFIGVRQSRVVVATPAAPPANTSMPDPLILERAADAVKAQQGYLQQHYPYGFAVVVSEYGGPLRFINSDEAAVRVQPEVSQAPVITDGQFCTLSLSWVTVLARKLADESAEFEKIPLEDIAVPNDKDLFVTRHIQIAPDGSGYALAVESISDDWFIFVLGFRPTAE